MIKQMLFGTIGGLGLFIYGLQIMEEGLQKAAGDRMRKILKALTRNALMGTLVGAIITSIIQSSSATTVMVIGFVNAGLMTFTQSLGVIFGANIGTTVTAQIIAFKLTDYALLFIALGFVLHFYSPKKFWKSLGICLLGFGLLFFGLHIMKGAIKPLSKGPSIRDIFRRFSENPLLGLLTGAIVTAVLQSSSATVGMVLALASANLLSLAGAIPLILGSNIGTCATALLASIGATKPAKQVAVAHVFFNIIGAFIFLPFLSSFEALIRLTSKDLLRQIANAHTLFNVMGTILFFPFVNQFAQLINVLVRGEEKEVEYAPKYLEEHLLNSPSMAIAVATKETIHTLEIARDMVRFAFEGFLTDDYKLFAKVERREQVVDNLRLAVTNYLIGLMEKDLNFQESRKIPALIHVINDVERIGDHAINLKELAEQKANRSIPFSDLALKEIQELYKQISQMIAVTLQALSQNNIHQAKIIFQKESEINSFRDRLKDSHIKQLEQGSCDAFSGLIFLDLVSNFEKIGDHLTNVGQAVTDALQWNGKDFIGD